MCLFDEAPSRLNQRNARGREPHLVAAEGELLLERAPALLAFAVLPAPVHPMVVQHHVLCAHEQHTSTLVADSILYCTVYRDHSRVALKRLEEYLGSVEVPEATFPERDLAVEIHLQRARTSKHVLNCVRLLKIWHSTNVVRMFVYVVCLRYFLLILLKLDIRI